MPCFDPSSDWYRGGVDKDGRHFVTAHTAAASGDLDIKTH
jgi:hypothetical protein